MNKKKVKPTIQKVIMIFPEIEPVILVRALKSGPGKTNSVSINEQIWKTAQIDSHKTIFNPFKCIASPTPPSKIDN